MKYGLIGKTLVHSYSKEIHEALEKYTYDLFSLTPAEMADFIKARDFGGLNVTIPYKQDVIPLCDEVSDLAAEIGAVNTLYWKANTCEAEGTDAAGKPNRRLVGHNTDYEGFLYAAKRAGIEFAGKTVLILGTGGTSHTARKAIADSNASKIYIASRSAAGKQTCETAQQSGGNAISDSKYLTQLTYDELPSVADSIEVIVNTTPVGTFPNTMQSVIAVADFPNCESVMDVIYNPFRTKLLLDAEKQGLRTSNGLPMLVAQATAAAGYFLGTPDAFTNENERIINKLESQMRNIVLIGMPGCGKSTIGKHLAGLTGKELIDMDEEIIKKAGMPIPEIFDKFGEKHFRDIESEVAAELGKQRNLIIATGGGAVLRQENVDALRQNAIVIHINRSVDSLPMHGRPLSKDIDTLREMAKVRMPIYKTAADITFDNSQTRSKQALKEALAELLKL